MESSKGLIYVPDMKEMRTQEVWSSHLYHIRNGCFKKSFKFMQVHDTNPIQ